MTAFKSAMVAYFLVVGVMVARGQTYVSENGNIHFFGAIIDSVTREPLPAAVIHQITDDILNNKKYTRFIVADKDGKFRFETPNNMPTRVEISCVGYKIRKFVLPKDQQTINLGKVWLAPDIQKIDEVVVLARMKMYEQFGDTTRIYARSVKTLKGDALIDILRQIPGIVVNPDGTVSMNGKLIERTLLNDKLIFGDDKVTALYAIEADQATTIDIYEEEAESETSFDKRKRKVMNIRTKKDFNRYFTANGLIEGGQNRDKDENGNREEKYDICGELGLFREGRQIQLNASRSNLTSYGLSFGSSSRYNNVLKTDPPYDATSVHGSLNRQINQLDGYSISFLFEEDKEQYTSGTTNTYFPTGYFESQITNAENNSVSTAKRYSIDMQSNYASRPDMRVRFGGSFTFSNTDKTRMNLSETFRDGALVTSTNSVTTSEVNRVRIPSSYLGVLFRLNKKNSMGIHLGASYDKSEGTESRDYEIMNTGLNSHTVLGVKSHSPQMDLSSSLQFTRKLDTLSISEYAVEWNVGMRYNKSKTYNIAIDDRTGLVDELYSGDYQVDEKTFSTGLNFYLDHVSLGATFNHTVMGHDERFPDQDAIHKTFNTWSPYARLQWGIDFMLTLSASQQIPTINLFTRMLDVSNPMFARAGNPDLDQTKEYRFHVVHNLALAKKQISFRTSATLKYSTDNVVYRRQYFENNTVLPGYDNYETPAGSTLVTPINGNHYWDLDVSTSMQKQIRYLGRLETIVSYVFSNPESEVDGQLVRLQKHEGSLDVKLATNFSRNVRINFGNKASYLWSLNSSDHKDQGFRDKATVHVQLSFLERVSLETGYIMDYYNSSLAEMNVKSHLLNATLGYRVFENRKGLISINAFDILNRNTNVSTSITDQYITNTWNRLFKSYYTLSFEYRFSSQK